MKKILDLSDRNDMFYWQTDRKITPSQIKSIFLNRRTQFDPGITKKAISFAMKKEVTELNNPIPFGSINNVVRATLSDETKVIIRMHPPGVKNGYFWSENVASQKAKDLGVPTYETYFIYDQQKEFNFDFMVMEQLKGKTMQELWPIDKKLDNKLIEETGKYTALIHKVKTTGFGFFKNDIAKKEGRLVGQYKSFKDHIFAALEDNLKFLTDFKAFDKETAKKVKKIFNSNLDLISCSNPSLVHNDIADWNELSDGEHITGIIDWDECFGGDPIMDFAQWSLFFEDARLKHFINGYKQINRLPDNFKAKIHLFRLRYLISKLALRQKRKIIDNSKWLEDRISRGLDVMKEEFKFFKL